MRSTLLQVSAQLAGMFGRRQKWSSLKAYTPTYCALYCLWQRDGDGHSSDPFRWRGGRYLSAQVSPGRGQTANCINKPNLLFYVSHCLNANIQTTFGNGSLGSRNDEERSEMR